MKTALQVVVIFSLFFTVGRLVAENLPPNISQKDKRFSMQSLTVKVGDSVTFTNDDPFFHNVFSLSPVSYTHLTLPTKA